ncbi:SCO2525 family SAM-dependent methyltransferase [Streptomyces prunicolor]|uniref:SCO2525 family SAM-dependent methyltransferase n=1 Tax=Streptomyces prunicolor TaxID=67348 RepID=UPI0007C59743|nr:SCO2525 family SAM-dependent methyltransferase [Streptomyces prunicolor]
MTLEPSGSPQKLNCDVDWSLIDPEDYIRRNYLALHPDDRAIISAVRDHFSDHFQKNPGSPASGIDVGAGPNIYPALTMLPWCHDITLFERSPSNVKYLESQRDGTLDSHWDKFWDVLCENADYGALEEGPARKFQKVAKVRQGNLFDLVKGEERWDIGTMFFVAESITESFEEFRSGVSSFMNALEPGAPFAAAFMEHSLGYQVGREDFPAIDVGEREVLGILKEYAGDVNLTHFGKPGNLVRKGYTGMILACGHRNN